MFIEEVMDTQVSDAKDTKQMDYKHNALYFDPIPEKKFNPGNPLVVEVIAIIIGICLTPVGVNNNSTALIVTGLGAIVIGVIWMIIGISADKMNKMISADRQTIAVAGDLPNRQFGICRFHTRCNSASASVNGVKSVSVHIIRKSGRTSDSGNDGCFVRVKFQLRHRFVQRI